MKTRTPWKYPLRQEFQDFLDGVKRDLVQKGKSYMSNMRFFAVFRTNANERKASTFRLFVSGTYAHQENTLTGFAINCLKCIHRCFPVIIDKAWLGLSGAQCNQYRLLETVNHLLSEKKDFILDVYDDSIEGYIINLYTNEDKEYNELFNDELGDCADISDVKEISLVSIPDELLQRKYKLVGEQFYAPNTLLTSNNSIDVLLYAELNNKYDKFAIKVLRWVQGKFSCIGDEEFVHNELLCNLGYISREQNNKLHTFMIENNCRILFGKLIEKDITILGGLEIFYSDAYEFPTFLTNIQVL